jgi:uncharacterized LabA/DUF88 family protein
MITNNDEIPSPVPPESVLTPQVRGERPRRFGPRRSRAAAQPDQPSAALDESEPPPSVPEPERLKVDAAHDASAVETAALADTPDLAPSADVFFDVSVADAPSPAEPVHSPQQAPAVAKPARSRAGRTHTTRSQAATEAPEGQPANRTETTVTPARRTRTRRTAAPPATAEVTVPADETQAALGPNAQSPAAEKTAHEVPAPKPAGRSRRARTRTPAPAETQPAGVTIPAQTVQMVAEAPVLQEQVPVDTEPVALESASPLSVVPMTPEPPQAAAGMSPELTGTAEEGAPQPSILETAAQATDLWAPEAAPTLAEGPTQDDLLTRALRELFPLPAQQEGTTQDETTVAGEMLAETDVVSEETLPAGEEQEGNGTATAEALVRRGRRGRRGGRGRKRGSNGEAAATPDLTAAAPAANVPAAGPAPMEAAPSNGTVVAPIDPALFVPETPTRAERLWRERGPRRVWGRTYPREERPVQMPPPKPSVGLRHGPLPQFVPPVAEPAPELTAPEAQPFVLPDLRIDAPLVPGETRLERLVETQTRLLQALVEQQAAQIQALTTSVQSLRQTVQQSLTARTYQPRTGIFVDAPNVCYAADNARVNLDFGRMLRYLSRDRLLVHALSYAPITDDVREGIRYETQRFVAPFLRTGWKLITKPLKRFADGSAKGNFDIELAIDIVTMAERLDIVVLVSGDSDFERLIQLIQSKGVRVEVVAFASNASTELVNIADVFIDISQHLEHMRAL